MEVWKELIEKESNDAYDFYDDPQDTLLDYHYAIVDIYTGDILMVDKSFENLQDEFENGVLKEFDAISPAILEIETDVFFVPETNTIWSQKNNVRVG